MRRDINDYKGWDWLLLIIREGKKMLPHLEVASGKISGQDDYLG